MCSWTIAHEQKDFLECLAEEIENYTSIFNIVYTSRNSSYASILQFSIKNLRFSAKSTPKPLVIITPEYESQIPPIIQCAEESDLKIRTRSGGHDYEGLSYVSQAPFIVIDLIRLSRIIVDVETKTAWVGAGATLGSLYYRIAEKSLTLGFPAGVCPTVGVGGHFSGGGWGTMFRKYGLAADNIIDGKIVDVNGRILDRRSMGEDLFWAIRGGGGASFGVILAWKVQLVDVPEKVTFFSIDRTLEQNATRLIHRWQYISHRLDKDLFIVVNMRRLSSTNDTRSVTVVATFLSLFLGRIDKLLPLVQENFPELGLTREDCREMSWIESILNFAGYPNKSLEALLNRTSPNVQNFKAKSDYVQKPIPKYVLEGIWRLFSEPEARQAEIGMIPYGGRMDEISESSIPFPHRTGNLYNLASVVYWTQVEAQNATRYISWIRKFYSYMTPYVSMKPRAAYINYRDLDIGVNNNEGETSYAQASIWGFKYFKNNFNRLVQVKSVVDPSNFFSNEQSIPSLHERT